MGLLPRVRTYYGLGESEVLMDIADLSRTCTWGIGRLPYPRPTFGALERSNEQLWLDH